MRDSTHSSGLTLRLTLLAAVLLALAEGLYRALADQSLDAGAVGPLASPVFEGLTTYWRARAWALAHPWFAGVASRLGHTPPVV